MTEEERFWSKVEKTETCWIWKGNTSSKDPKRAYGSFHSNGISRRAHRVAWEFSNKKPFPEGMDACHHCDNPRCVNPDHIFPGTAADNARDAIKKGRYWNQSSKTECRHGHPLSGDNLYIKPTGQRQCRQCRRDWDERNRPWGHHRRLA